MTINEPLIVKCPDCNTIFRFIGLCSYTVCIAGAFSDGFSYPSTFSAPTVMPVFYCRRCREWKALSSVVELFEGPMEFIEAEGIPELPKSYMKEEEFESALKQSWPEDIELGLRMEFLQTQNAKRRNAAREIPAGGNLKENLNRLSELIKAEEYPFMAAEIRRELGDFDKALAIVEKLGKEDDYRIPALKEKIAEKSVNPFFIILNEEKNIEPVPVAVDIKKEASPELLARFKLYPPPEDVIPFPSIKNLGKDDGPYFLVKITQAGEDIWIPCVSHEDENLLFRYGRAFRDWEWKWFDENVIWEWETELKWFWSQNSEDMAKRNDEQADRYYKRLYQIHYNRCFISDDYGLDTEGLNYELEVMLDTMLDRFEDKNDYYRTFWELYWRHMATDFCDNFDPETFDLEAERAGRKKAEEELESKRKRNEKGLKHWEDGEAANGVVYVGQIWLDYIGGPDTLLRLVYDPSDNTVGQATEHW